MRLLAAAWSLKRAEEKPYVLRRSFIELAPVIFEAFKTDIRFKVQRMLFKFSLNAISCNYKLSHVCISQLFAPIGILIVSMI